MDIQLIRTFLKNFLTFYPRKSWAIGGDKREIGKNWEKLRATWLFGFIALLFNPLIPIHLSREIWQPIDVICALLFVIAAIVLKEQEEKHQGE